MTQLQFRSHVLSTLIGSSQYQLNTRPHLQPYRVAHWFVGVALLHWQLKVQSPLILRLAFPLRIREILCSILSPETGHRDWGYSWLPIIRK
jgi:hypothetical protein